jgi:hypothetical protein
MFLALLFYFIYLTHYYQKMNKQQHDKLVKICFRYHDVWLQGDRSSRDRYPVRLVFRLEM